MVELDDSVVIIVFGLWLRLFGLLLVHDVRLLLLDDISVHLFVLFVYMVTYVHVLLAPISCAR